MCGPCDDMSPRSVDPEPQDVRKENHGVRHRALKWFQRQFPLSDQTSNLPSPLSPDTYDSSLGQHHPAMDQSPHILPPTKVDRFKFQGFPSNHHSKRGQLPLSALCADELGDVHSENTYVKRDLGFQGQIGQNVLLSYGDTMYSDANYSDTWRGMTSDSVALATHNPLVVYDPDLNEDGYPKQFCPLNETAGEDPSSCALGITNVVETYPNQGILYFLLNHRPDGNNKLMGAGVATITLSDSYPPVPSIQRLGQFWWDAATEPWYGDVGAVRGGDYIYAYGHAQDSPYVYLTRVPWQSATDLACYEYWNGETWQTERLYNVGEKEGVFWQINQGQVIWSNYYSCFLFVYCDNWMNSKVLAKTAPAPEGPWSEPITLYQATPITPGSSIYAAVPHPYYDQTGKTLVVTFTNHPNCIQAVKVTFV